MNYRFFTQAMLAGLVSLWSLTALAEGTKQTTATSSDYTHLLTNYSEYNDFGRYNGTEDQRLFIHIEDPENEVVYFGFSQFYDQPHWPNVGNSRTGYFRIKDPSGNVVWPTAGSPAGQQNNAAISNWSQAVNGPNQIVGSGGYNAFTFNPDGLPAGDYYIEFSASQSSYNSDDLIIPYYDITVATEGGSPTAIDGRVFSYNWAFMTPAIDYPNDYFDRDFTGVLYIYSDDGFVSSIDFSQAGFQGAAFNIAFNSSGTSATGVFEVDRASVEGSNVTFAEYRVFLNNPDETAFPNGTFGEFVVNADFPKLYGCPDDSEWFFRFAATEAGRVGILIDSNGNGEYDPGTADVLLTQDIVPFPGETSPYDRDIPWNGLDGLGNPIPTGTPLQVEYRYSQGFYHLPVYDVEHLRTGMEVQAIRPVTPQPYDPDFFYDDEDISETLPGGQPALELDGCNPPCHYWNDIDYGNVNTINTFWYAYRSKTAVTIPFETPPPTCAGCPFVPFEILGRVVLDIDENGVEDGSDYGFGGITVNVYEDANGNGTYESGTDPLIDTDVTDANGDYSLIGQIATDHLIVIDQTGLPANSSLTTPNIYGVEFSSLYDADCDGLFGFVTFPIANTDYDTIPDTSIPLVVCVQDNDVDPLGGGLTTSIVIPPVNGGTAVVQGLCIEYTSIPDYIGVDSLLYSICSPEGLCDSAWVIIQIGDICGDGIDNDGDGIIDNYSPEIVITASGTDPYCTGFSDGVLTSSATGGRAPFTITWYENGVPFASTANVSDLPAGTYVVDYEDANGCKENETVVLDDNNCPPIANNDFANTLVDVPVGGNVLTNDWDLNGDNLIVTTTPVSGPSNGSVVLNANGSYTYTPNAGFEGEDEFVYSVCDDGIPSLCDQATVYIEVIPITSGNEPPIANADVAQTMEDVPVSGNILVNDDDPDGDNIILNTTPITGPSNGSVTIQSNGDFTYTPNPGFIGTDTYIYSICDDAVPSLCDTAIVTINVVPDSGPDNDPPFAGDDAALTPQEVPVSGNLLTNDFDPNGDNIIINTTQISGPSNGTVTINSNGDYTYTPNPGFIGPDQFVYEICDDGTPSLCAQATCYITVYPDNNPPVATDDINSTLVGVPVSGNVTTNDWDPDGDDLTVTTTPLIGPSNGSVVLNPDGSYTYTPTPGFDGEDSFTYVTCDNGVPSLCDTAEVSIEVVPITTGNEPPVAQDDAAQTQVDTPVSGNVLVNDDDPDGDNIILNLTPITGPSNGSVTLFGNGTFNYTPDPGFIGTDVFTYSICDDQIPSLCDTAEVTIVVLPDYNGPDNDPPFAGDDFALTPQEVPVSGDLLVNDWDVNGDNIIINTTPVSGPSNGSVVVNSNGTYTYTPNPGYTGPDQFVYEICDDGTPSLCAQATCYITVYPGNNPPVAVDDFNNTLVDTPVSGNVVTNDSDPNGDNLTVNPSPVSGPDNGTLVLTPGGAYTYTPNNGFEGEDTFTYVVCDDGTPSMCDTATVTISVIPVTDDNDPPVANPDAYVTQEDVPVTGNITANDDDPDGDNIILNTTPITGPSNGSVTVAANGNIVYTPNPGFTGTDSFTYSICDDGTPSLCDTTVVTIIVTPDYNGPDNDPPFAGDDAALTPMNVPVSGDHLVNDFDPNGDNIIINTTPVSGPSNGSVVINSNGTYTYTPNNGYIGPDQFVYQICDDGSPSLCAQATCYITVFPGPGISYTITEPLCHGEANGSIDITVNNATPPLTYSWSNGATTEDLNNVVAGTYVVTVTDAQGSVIQETIELTQPAVLGVVVDVQDETIVNGCNGSATANPTGGTAPYTYIWSDGQTTQTAVGLCAGIYTVTITDANGCDVTTSRVINPPSCDLDVNVTGQPVGCNGGSNGSVLATPVTQQNNTPFTYLWNNGATTQQITGVDAGPYSVTVTDSIGCTASGSFVVTEPPMLSVSTSVVDELTFQGCDGSATATASGGTPPYLYEWSDNQIGQTASNLCPGNYTVTITDANGCTVQRTVTINALSCTGFSVAINTYSLSCFQANDGAAVAVVSGGTAPFTYFWTTGGATVDSIGGLGAGTYQVIVTDSVNCQQTVSGVVTQPALLEASTAVDPVTCHGLANGTIELTVTGGTTPYSFNWSNGATTEDLNNLGPGTYGVTVTDANDCFVISSGAVTEPDTLDASSVDTDATCFGGNDGMINLTAEGGLPPYQYSWSNGPTSEDISGLSAGTYTVTFVDQNACVYVYTTTVGEASLFEPTITADGPTTFCAGDSVVLTATAGAQYLWSNGATTQSISVFSSGVYTVSVTTDDGCDGDSDPIQVTVNSNPNPTVSPIGSTTFCNGGSVTLTTGSYATYLWSTGATTQSITVTASGSYSVSVTDGNGCEGTSASLNVTVNDLPEPTVTASGDLEFCAGSNVTLTASAAASYLWSNGQTTQSITVSNAGTFTVTVTDVNGCQGTSDPVTTVVFPTPTPTITADGPTIFCDGDSVVLTSSSASLYQWSTGATTQSITVFTSGNYSVTVTDANDCVGTSAPVQVTVNNNPTPTITANGDLEFCDGDSVVLTSSLATSYLWSTGATSRSITVFTSGDYYVTATLGTGCSGTSDTTTVTVFSNPTPTVTADGPTEFCAGDNVVLTATPGNSYLWNTGATSQSITVTTSGQRWVTVTNVNGCSGISDTVDVVVNPNPTPTITPDGPLEFCDGDSVTLTSSAADAYLWSNGATTQSTVVYASGTYSVTVTDANGCQGTSAPVTVVVNELPFSFIFATGPTTFCEGDSVSLVARESDAYLWSNGDTTRIITVNTSGTYSVEVFDENGCSQESNEITVTVNPNPQPTISANGPLQFCDGDNVILTLSGSGTYTWNTGETTRNISAEETGSYWGTVVDNNGCEGQSDTVDVEVWELPEPEITTIGTPSFCAGDTIFLTTTEMFESYLWSTGDTTQTTFSLTTGFVIVEVTDTNGCVGVSPEELITVNVNPNPTTTPDGTVEICDGDTITITSVMAESYLWTTGDTTQSIHVWQAGSYNVTATDQNGCTGTSSDVIVIVNQPPSPVITADGDLDFCLGGSVTLSTGDYVSYQWSTGANGQSILVNQSGTYTVTVTDSAGCSAAAAQADVTVYQPPIVSVSVTGPQQFCFGDSAVLTATPGYNGYLWSNGATTESITVYTSGSFNVTVTDEYGCTATSQLVTIEVYSLPNADIIATGPTEFCAGESVTLTATGGQSYVWNTGATTNSIVVSNAGNYYVVANNQFGCIDTSASLAVQINNPPLVTVFPSGPTEFCDGGSVLLVASGADNYEWSTGETGVSIVAATTGVYSVTGTDANGCSTESGGVPVTVFNNPVPVITPSGPTEFCAGDSVVLTSSAADSYLWSTGAVTQSITVFTSGSYEVSVVDANGCEGTSARVIVTVNNNPVPTISLSGPAEFCDGDSVTLTSSAADAYLWSTGDTTQAIVVYAGGDYSVEVTDQNGCSGLSADVSITVYQNPQPVISASDTVACDGQVVTLTSSQADGYLWNTGAMVQSISVTQSGIYTVTVTDGNGCLGSDDVEITINPVPTPVPVITPDGPTTFCDGDSVTLSVDAWNSYLWSPTGDTTQTLLVSESGLYVVTVTNEYGCAADAAGIVVTVNPNPNPVITANGDSAICDGETILLGTSLYNAYDWSTGDTTQVISVDQTGSYSVTVTNQFGCVGTSEAFEVVQNPNPEISVEADGPTTICNGDEVVLSAVGNGPYLWNTGDTTQSITVSDAGIYYVQATDTVTGCVGVSDDVEVDFFPLFDPDIIVDGNTSFCEGEEAILTVVNGTSFLWSTGDTTQSITVTTTGVYTVTAVDQNGCSGTAGQPIVVLPSPITQIIPDSEFPYCNGDVVTLTALGIPFIDDFEWNTGETSQTIEVTQSGVYTVTVTNPAGCSSTASLPIGFLPLPPTDIFVNGETSICDGDEVQLTVLAPPFGFDFEWSNGETSQTITVTESGNYEVTVTSLAGCTATSEPISVTVVPGPTADAGPDQAICIGDTVVLTATGGENIVWMPGGQSASISVSPLDDTMYIIEVTNEGCNQVAVDTVNVTVQAYPTAYFGYGETNLGEPVLFADSSTVPPLFSWDWDFGDGSGSAEQNPSHDYEEPGNYVVTLTVSTSNGCSDTYSDTLDVQEFFVITNVLTPNDDGFNDYIWITSSLAEKIEAKIYNRWGFSVWEGIGTDLRFAGKTSGGVDLQAGTYYYTISIDYGTELGVRELTGYITLIR
ncbi:MAG: tandem-95 repeat protein [Flavobacteriales bacterium]|nr:tandem-95 repeat protein [Flavobacteriales bacterium]